MVLGEFNKYEIKKMIESKGLTQMYIDAIRNKDADDDLFGYSDDAIINLALSHTLYSLYDDNQKMDIIGNTIAQMIVDSNPKSDE